MEHLPGFVESDGVHFSKSSPYYCPSARAIISCSLNSYIYSKELQSECSDHWRLGQLEIVSTASFNASWVS